MLAHKRNGYRYPTSGQILTKARHLQSGPPKWLRSMFGYLHLLAGMIFSGAIFYIRIFAKPTRLKDGIPSRERVLGLSCMGILSITGIYLVWVRIGRWEPFFSTTFGLMLFIAIVLFSVMVFGALTAATVAHRRMQREGASGNRPEAGGRVGRDNLYRYDGKGGNPAYILFYGRVYDVSNSVHWKQGRHFGKHTAGADLSDAIKGAPHGATVLDRVPCLGEISAAAKTPKTETSEGQIKKHKQS